MKNKILVSSFLTIALCLCLIAGSTFALFTERAEVNLAVTAGDLVVKAQVVDDSLKAMSGGDAGFGDDLNFDNGGSVTFDEATQTITVDKMTPGDAFCLAVKVTNESNINASYVLGWSSEVPTDKTNLLPALDFSVKMDDPTTGTELVGTDPSSYETAPVIVNAVADGQTETLTTFYITVTFTDDDVTDSEIDDGANDNNLYQDAALNLSFYVEAQQAYSETNPKPVAP